MTQPVRNNDYYTSPAWRTPAELDGARWDWLQNKGFPLLARALDEIVTRLDRIEQKLDALETQPQPTRRRRRVAPEEPPIEQ